MKEKFYTILMEIMQHSGQKAKAYGFDHSEDFRRDEKIFRNTFLIRK